MKKNTHTHTHSKGVHKHTSTCMQIDPNPSASASTWPLHSSFGFTWDPHNRWVNVCIAFCFTIEICTAPQFLETWWSGCFVPIQMSSWWMDNWRSEPGTKGRLDNQENTEACWMSLVFHLRSKLFNNVEGPLNAQLSVHRGCEACWRSRSCSLFAAVFVVGSEAATWEDGCVC